MLDSASARALLATAPFVAAAAVFFACGASAPSPSPPGDGDGDPCTAAIDAVIHRGCAQCWPAYRLLCTQGNGAAVQGMAACLTSGTCWDVGDPNTAVPCMQQVVDANLTPTLTAIRSKLSSIGCFDAGSESGTELESCLVMLSPADQAKYATCIAGASSCGDPRIASCLSAGTAFDQSRCEQ